MPAGLFEVTDVDAVSAGQPDEVFVAITFEVGGTDRSTRAAVFARIVFARWLR